VEEAGTKLGWRKRDQEEAGDQDITPLAGLTALTWLELSGNPINNGIETRQILSAVRAKGCDVTGGPA